MAAEIALLRPESRDEAIAILENGCAFHRPADLNRRRLDLLMQTDRWQAIDQALAGLRAALAEAGAPAPRPTLQPHMPSSGEVNFDGPYPSTKPHWRRT